MKLADGHTNDSVISMTATTYRVKTRTSLDSQNFTLPSKESFQPQITIVTAFFDIGKFGKGSPSNIRSIVTYLKWAQTFMYLLNPVVVYTDSEEFYSHMKTLRTGFENKTKLFLFNRTSSWAFERKQEIREIFSLKGYPKYYPNTVVPEYSCAMHAKYDVVSRAAKRNYFHTPYFAWLDIGLFRGEVNSKKYFILDLPPHFNHSRIAVNQVYNVLMDKKPIDIIKQKLDWICGCIFVGRHDVILKYTEQYKRAVDYFLSQKLMNTDQQILYAMYSISGRKNIKPDIDLQLYKHHNSTFDSWFYLGYMMRKHIE